MADPANTPTTGGASSGPKADGSGVYNPAVGYLNSEARRTLSSPTFQTGSDSVDIPRDTVIKRMYLKLAASFQATYASGSPVISQFGVFDRICSNVEINVNGGRVVKSVRPYLARLHNIMLSGRPPRRSYALTAANTAPVVTRGSFAWPAGTLAYPATTAYMLFNEGFELNFENVLGYGGSRHMSELDVRSVASATLKFSWNQLANVLADGNGASVTYANQSIVVTPQIVENRARPRPAVGATGYDYFETSFSQQYSGQARSQQIQLQTGNFLMALGILCINGDANLTPQENLLQNISLLANGASSIQGPISHQDLQDENISRFGVSDEMGLGAVLASIASNSDQHPLRGFALMNLIRNGNWNTALNTSRGAGIDRLTLQIDTPAAVPAVDGATYANPLQVFVHTHEIRPFTFTA